MKLNALHDDFISKMSQLIPDKFRDTWNKAITWKPKLKSWKYSGNKAANAVANGKKPAIYGYRQDYLKELANKFGLVTIGEVAVMPGNQDIAEFINWVSNSSLEKSNINIMVGIALGYPTQDVLAFSARSDKARI